MDQTKMIKICTMWSNRQWRFS